MAKSALSACGACVECGNEFEIKPGRGRPRIRCRACSPCQRGNPKEAGEPKGRSSKTFICSWCSASFQSFQRTAKFCSRTCLGQFNQKRLRGVKRVVRPIVACGHCGVKFEVPFPGGHQQRIGALQRFCSRSCASKACNHGRAALQEWNAARSEEASRRHKAHAAERKKAKAAAIAARLARDEAIIRHRLERLAALPVQTCAWCSAFFKPTRLMGRPAVCCSPRCSQKREGAMGNGKTRAKAAGVPYESIDPITVFRRDGWRCWICNGDTARVYAPRDPLSPTIDHVIPLARGGPHKYTNVRCAHAICNSRKSDRSIT